MPGPFGGELVCDEDGARERVPPEIAALLAASDAPSTAAVAAVGGAAAVIPYRLVEEELVFQGDLRDTAPLSDEGTRAERLATLAAAAQALAALHEQGRVHGDVRAETIRQGAGGTFLLSSAQVLNAPGLLEARLAAGARPAAVPFVAPEVVEGEQATQASDVYGLAAAAYRVLCGRSPLGRIGPGLVTRGLPSLASRALSNGVHADPDERPTAAALAEGLRAAAQALDGEREPEAGEPARTAAREDESQVSALLMLFLILGGSFVFCGALGFVVAGWNSMPGFMQVAVLALFTAGVWGGGALLERRGYARSGVTLTVLGSQLLWVDLANLLAVAGSNDGGPWTLGSMAITAVMFVLALRRDSVVFGLFSVLGFLVSAVALGDYLHSGSEYGALVFVTGVAIAHAGVAAIGHRFASRSAVLGLPFAVGGMLWLWAAAIAALAVLDGNKQLLEVVWLYGLGGLALGLGIKTPNPYRTLAFVAGGVILALGPTIQAMIESRSLPYLLWVVALGLCVLAAAFRVPAIAKSEGLQLATVLVGLFQSLAAPFVVCLDRCFDRDGMVLLEEALRSMGRVHETRFVYLSIPLGTSIALVALGFLFSRDAQRKLVYRLLEVAGLVNGFVLVTLLSLPDCDDEFFYVSILLVASSLLIALGITARRAMHVAIASAALLLNLFIQYFAKLSEAVHWGLLALGFGIALLILAVLYERKVKHLLPKLKEWA